MRAPNASRDEDGRSGITHEAQTAPKRGQRPPTRGRSAVGFRALRHATQGRCPWESCKPFEKGLILNLLSMIQAFPQKPRVCDRFNFGWKTNALTVRRRGLCKAQAGSVSRSAARDQQALPAPTPAKANTPHKSEVCGLSAAYSQLVGLAGFEPADDGVKVHCLTPWLQPITFSYYSKNPLKKQVEIPICQRVAKPAEIRRQGWPGKNIFSFYS